MDSSAVLKDTNERGVVVLPPRPDRRQAIRNIWAAREKAIADGMPTMTLDEIATELAHRRGEPDA